MGYIMDTKLAIKKYTTISKYLRKKYGNEVTITLGDMSNDKQRLGHFIGVTVLKNDNYFNISTYKSNQAFYDAIAKAFEPRWVQIKTICMDLIGTTVYVDKEVEIEVESINKQGVISTKGFQYNIDELWIKE